MSMLFSSWIAFSPFIVFRLRNTPTLVPDTVEEALLWASVLMKMFPFLLAPKMAVSSAPSPITTPVSYQESVGWLESPTLARDTETPFSMPETAFPMLVAKIWMSPAVSFAPSPTSAFTVCRSPFSPTPVFILELPFPTRDRLPGMVPLPLALVLPAALICAVPVTFATAPLNMALIFSLVYASPSRLPTVISPAWAAPWV